MEIIVDLKKFSASGLFTALFAISSLSANTLLDSENFNVTLDLAPAHYLNVSDLSFGYVNPIKINEDDLPIESTTGSVVAYSNAQVGHYVQIIASDTKYLSDDGLYFLMRGLSETNDDSIAFVLQSSFTPEGSQAENGRYTISPGDKVIAVDGSDENHKVVRDLWASLKDNAQLKNVASDKYLAILTANHYSNQ
jgi:hypothetical protein